MAAPAVLESSIMPGVISSARTRGAHRRAPAVTSRAMTTRRVDGIGVPLQEVGLALLVPYVKRPFAPVLVPRGGVNCAMVALHGFLAKDS